MQKFETVDDVIRFIRAPKRPIIQEWALQNQEEAYNHEDLLQTLLRLRNKI